MNDNTTGTGNVANGLAALLNNTTGDINTAIGNKALYANTTASNNTALGYFTLGDNTTGFSNTAVGINALRKNNTRSNLVAIGDSALFNNGIGAVASFDATLNTAVGSKSLFANTIGRGNTASGYQSMTLNTDGNFNTAHGNAALSDNTTGDFNTAIGNNALTSNVTGSSNTAVGSNAGFGAAGISFTNCTFIGNLSSPTVARTNVTMLGANINNAQCTGDNQVLLGNTAITQIRAQVAGITAYSDARFKTNISDNVKGLDFIMRLKPVTYNQRPKELHKIWGDLDKVKDVDFTETEKQLQIGFLAQDVEAAAKASGFNFPGIDVPKNSKEVYSLRYVDFIMPMVKATQEQQQQIEELKTQNELLKKQNEEILKRLAALEKK
jgi:hypothetical protein